jgi:hypothetical protein
MAEWTVLKQFAARFEADLPLALLEDAGIPVFVRGPETGIFGPGFAGATAAGVTILVHEEDLERAQDVIDAASAEEGKGRPA